MFLTNCNTNSHIQEYECQVIKNNVAFDGCLWQELNYLWEKGIKTIGSCCGHHINAKENKGYIQVEQEFEAQMVDLGYRKIINQHGITIFKPKTQIIEV